MYEKNQADVYLSDNQRKDHNPYIKRVYNKHKVKGLRRRFTFRPAIYSKKKKQSNTTVIIEEDTVKGKEIHRQQTLKKANLIDSYSSILWRSL